ncbi:PilZ domain-containing protein [Agrobacterium sp. O3.4]|uniref:PilZ domain-containing protein n=1 Tax=Agrobacterium cucumeris TaxID=2862866 RepID=A0ABY8RPX7_9HYPH|nr:MULTISPECIES: PilZ domain-containing protein [Rhizobium/Agrobacterium group]MCZ7469749.1 PilZ domain-containing protein [Rhizobium rhizogenes]WHO09551.1 PilZ domain-containing protein [Agrobacterium cucumeris]
MFSSRSVNTAQILRPVEEVPLDDAVAVSFSGRLMLPDHEEYDCTATEMTAERAQFTCSGMARNGDRVIAYLQHIGRIEGSVTSLTASGFVISINAPERKREKLAAQLAWIAKRQLLGLPEDRRHDRLTPRNAKAHLVLEDGVLVSCRLIDLSLSGAAIEVENRPPLGSRVQLGKNMSGKIVRHFMEGVAVEFDRVQSPDALIEFL